MKQIEVQIMGTSYVLDCPEGGEQELLDAVRTVDEAMCKIRDAGKTKARERVAVLAALNIVVDSRNEVRAALSIASQNSVHQTGNSVGSQEGAALAASQNLAINTSDARLHGLVERLDTALTEDGRLL